MLGTYNIFVASRRECDPYYVSTTSFDIFYTWLGPSSMEVPESSLFEETPNKIGEPVWARLGGIRNVNINSLCAESNDPADWRYEESCRSRSSCPNHEGLGLSVQSPGKEINILSEKALFILRFSNIIPSVSIRIDVTLWVNLFPAFGWWLAMRASPLDAVKYEANKKNEVSLYSCTGRCCAAGFFRREATFHQERARFLNISFHPSFNW